MQIGVNPGLDGVGIPAYRGPNVHRYATRPEFGEMNIFSLLFCEVSLLLKFFSLLLFWSLLAI
jgi:hypothetical protein